MERINASSLLGARAYFTGFDRHVLGKSSMSDDQIQRLIKRDLKMLLLSKQQVISGASTLTSTRFVYKLLKDNPILLEAGLILPALEEKKASPLDYLSRIKKASSEELAEMHAFYERSYNTAVSWKLADNSGWFKNTFLAGLTERNGVLRLNLAGLDDSTLANLIQELKGVEILDKPFIEQLALGLSEEEAAVLRNYRDLIYQMSGARVVNCESVLPQETYVDYSLADMANRKTILSEGQIFWKLFIELFFETIGKPKLPVQVLDLLSFEDIAEIREPLLNSSFTEDYEQVIRAAVGENDGWQEDKVLLSLEELLSARERLVRQFKQIFDEQINGFLKRRKIDGGELIKTDFNLSTQYRPATAALSLSGSPSSLVNASTDLPTARAVRAYDKETEGKLQLSRKLLKSATIDNKTAFVDAIALLTDRLQGRTIS